ncbi:MAG: Nif3-like dinuclear metal center hexameric protein [Eubacteriales bacterium]|nr:Nif3-like dinuclear metal center hexameric protein [Eubacteriales bacterium]
MLKTSVKNIYDILNSLAPFDSAEEYDNVGLLVGDLEQEVSKILVVLDVTHQAIEKAVNIGAQLIISHHPLMFSPIRNITTASYEGDLIIKLIQHRISLIAAHTNADKTFLSGSAAVAEKLKLENIYQTEDPYIFIGTLTKEMTGKELNTLLEKLFNNKVILHGNENKKIRRLAIAGGAYSEGFVSAKKAEADAYLTGEIKHHHILEATAYDLVLFQGGHFETEYPMIEKLARCLQKELNQLQSKAEVYS